ncbi:DUF6447 family protein [Paracraurococcus lichenis]|uniref:DUF6447 family protein n=1 Tax=Paracraurococcus lichenis TaxID=3064888 RepID=A0ABT9EDP7_9PROT|nr:DUF6447 family protein [Paracraurococcus sp. LOR1-02]MDO9714339.1 DUF6447 family protein [Paracraurococcus sp. LOR1-02]
MVLPLLTQQPAPVTRRDLAISMRFLGVAQAALEAMFLGLRAETDRVLGQGAPARYGKAYPYGYCREITQDVLARLKQRLPHSDCSGLRAVHAFLAAGGEGRCVWGILRGRYFQTALQFGALYVDVANDTVIASKPKVEILPMAEAGLETVRDVWHFAGIAEGYWDMRIYANHALPALAPLLPMIGVTSGMEVCLQSATDYMVGLFCQDGFCRSEDWLTRGPRPPTGLVEALRSQCPAELLSSNREAGAEAAIAACRSARAQGLASSEPWLRARVADHARLHAEAEIRVCQARSPSASSRHTGNSCGSMTAPPGPRSGPTPGEPMSTLTLDGRAFEIESLPDTAKAQIMGIRFVDGEITRLQAQLAAMQTARTAYVEALRAALPAA